MAPGRKRGAKGAKAKSLKLGDLVLAKVKGHPAWPAKIGRPEDWDKIPDPKKIFVHFFGTNEIAFVAPADIQEFTIEAKNKLAARCKGKTVKYFSTAVEEICAAFEELQEKSSSGLGADTDKYDIGSEAPSAHGVPDDARLTGLEVKNSVDQLHGERVLEVPADHGCGLERCSQRQGEMDCQDNKPKNREDSVAPSEPSWIADHIKGLVASKDSSYSEAGQSLGGGGKDSSSPVPSSVNPRYEDSGPKEATNSHKSKKIISGSRKRLQGDTQVQKVNSSGAVKSSLHGNSSDHVNILKSGEGSARKSLGSSGGLKDSSPDKSRSNLDTLSDKRQKQSLKDKVHLERAEDLLDKKATNKKHDAADLSGRKTKSQLGHGKHNLVTVEASHPVKRSKSADITLDNTKGSVQKNRNTGYIDSKAGNAEVRRSMLQGYAEDCLAPRDEEVFPPNKRRRQVPDIVDGSSTRASDNKTEKGPVRKSDNLFSDKAKSPAGQYPKKRRAVRLYDDDDDEPKTPVHGGHVRKVDAPLGVLGSVKNGPAHSGQASGVLDNGGPSKVSLSTVKILNESLTQNSHKRAEVQKPISIQETTNIPISRVKAESNLRSSEAAKPVRLSPVRSALSTSTGKSAVESLKADIPGKVSDNIFHRNSQAGSNKNMVFAPDCADHSPSQGMRERNKSTAFVERKKDTPKSSSRMNDSILSTDKTLDISSINGDRMDKDKEAAREDKMFVLVDPKVEDSSSSMKHLIAVAQAKRREAYSQSFIHGNSYPDLSGGSPSVLFAIPPTQPSSNIQADIQVFNAQSSLSSHIPQPSAENHPEVEEFEDQRYGSGHRAPDDPLSGGTEAAVARDAFEGMIETLSRTKESIGRATRLAIDCAKYGIASEVVELLIHKLETESSLHRKVDLFFLVDSITQCSHSQKGVAGASYIPTVQSALPRLLGAAAPPEAAARENRRQCLKVLRLWLERKILPDSLLRQCMDDIGVSNDESSAGAFLRRPSRAERAVDDPIREMEGMLVDEYGSNATFQLPGFVTSHVFDDEEEEDEFQIPACKESTDISPVELTPTAEEVEKFTVNQNDRRHCILEDVDGELEMEDVSVHPKDEGAIFMGAPFEIVSKEEQGSDMILEAESNSCPQLPFPMGSPPSPPDSPPPTPPLPTSPRPPSLPPLPPLPPSSPPPPPPPLAQQAQPHPPPLAGMLPYVAPQSSVMPQTSSLPQHLHTHPFQSSVPSSSPKMTYQLQGNQLSQLAGGNSHGAHIDANIRNEMYIQPCYVSSGVGNVRETSGYNSGRPLDCGNTDPYTNHQSAQPSQQFQPMPLPQRPFHPAPPPQAPSSHFSYSNPAVQQRPQHQYPQPYTLPSHPDGPRQYHTDDKWRMQSSEFSTNNPNGPWMNGMRSSLIPVPPFAHEGYFRPPPERPPPAPASFQQSAVNSIPAVPPIQGQNGPQMMPCRPDLSSLGSWRPA